MYEHGVRCVSIQLGTCTVKTGQQMRFSTPTQRNNGRHILLHAWWQNPLAPTSNTLPLLSPLCWTVLSTDSTRHIPSSEIFLVIIFVWERDMELTQSRMYVVIDYKSHRFLLVFEVLAPKIFAHDVRLITSGRHA